MDRRGFLKTLFAFAAAEVASEVIDLDRLLWVPKPMIVVPAMPTGHMPEDEVFRNFWLLSNLKKGNVFKARGSRIEYAVHHAD